MVIKGLDSLWWRARGALDGPAVVFCAVVITIAAAACSCRRERQPDVELSRLIPEVRGMALIGGGEVVLEIPTAATPTPAAAPDPDSALENGSLGPVLATTRTVRVEPFFMDRFEVTNTQYHRFLLESGYEPDPDTLSDWPDGAPSKDLLDMPKVFVSFAAADAFARYYGKRLPTTAEWLLATEGETGRSYPWGRSFNRNRLNCLETGMLRPWRVGTFESGKSVHGLYDLMGNASEWTWMPDDPDGMHAIVGGSWRRAMAPQERFEPIKWWWSRAEEWNSEIGFRCVLDVTPDLYDRFLELLDGSQSVRVRVMEDLVRLDEERAVETLAALQRHERHPYVRVVAAQKLLNLGRQDRIDIRELIRAVQPGSTLDVRDAAVSCISLLQAFGADLQGVSAPLLRILKGLPGEPQPRPRSSASSGDDARRLAKTSDPEGADDGALELPDELTLVQLYRDLARLLVELEELGIYEFLVQQARFGRVDYRAASAAALGHVKMLSFDQDRLALDLFEILRRSEREDVRGAAFDSIAGLEVESGLLRVLRGLDDDDLRIRAAAELQWFATLDSLDALCDVLGEEGIAIRVRLTAAYSLLWMNVKELIEEPDDDSWTDPYTRRAIEAIDQAMPTFVDALDSLDQQTRVYAAAVVRTFLDRVDIPRLAAAYWLAWRPLVDRVGYQLGNGLEQIFTEYGGAVYGVHPDMEDYGKKEIEPLRPCVIKLPYLTRARAVGIELTEQAEAALIPVGPIKRADAIRARRIEKEINETVSPEDLQWVRTLRNEIRDYLVLARARGFDDLNRIQRDPALSSFRYSGGEDEAGEHETAQYLEVRELYSR